MKNISFHDLSLRAHLAGHAANDRPKQLLETNCGGRQFNNVTISNFEFKMEKFIEETKNSPKISNLGIIQISLFYEKNLGQYYKYFLMVDVVLFLNL